MVTEATWVKEILWAYFYTLKLLYIFSESGHAALSLGYRSRADCRSQRVGFYAYLYLREPHLGTLANSSLVKLNSVD